MRAEQKSQFLAFFSQFHAFYGKKASDENAELAWKLIEPLERTNEQIEQAFFEAMRAHTGDFPPQFTAVIEQLRAQSPVEKQIAALPPARAIRRPDPRAWLADLRSMLQEASARGPMSEAQRQEHLRVLASAPRDPSPPMSPCQFPGCPAPGTISPSTTGGGPWYCAAHFNG